MSAWKCIVSLVYCIVAIASSINAIDGVCLVECSAWTVMDSYGSHYNDTNFLQQDPNGIGTMQANNRV